MPAITVAKNGMLVAKDLRLVSVDGEEIASVGIHRLCRCGASKTKPFCDNTHLGNGFTGDKGDGRVPERLDEFAGKKLTILDDRGACAHTGFCTDMMPNVWNSGKEPWIDADAGPAADIIDVIRRCPSGALAYKQDGKVHDSYSDDPAIVVAPAGPFRVRGGPELKDPDGNTPRSTEHYTLCRCGASKNKPFCDGSHWYVNFAHVGPAVTAETETEGYEEVGSVTDFEEGSPKQVTVGGADVAVFKLWGRVCAVAAQHRGDDMLQATVEGGKLVGDSGNGFTPYPWQRAEDDDLPVHQVMVLDGKVFVAVQPEAS